MLSHKALINEMDKRIYFDFERSGSKYAKHLGVSPAYISATRTMKKKPSDKILNDLGFEAVTTYKKVK